ncbi:hypothetical protein ACLOJK_005321, partial [Asimina triloba]
MGGRDQMAETASSSLTVSKNTTVTGNRNGSPFAASAFSHSKNGDLGGKGKYGTVGGEADLAERRWRHS